MSKGLALPNTIFLEKSFNNDFIVNKWNYKKLQLEKNILNGI